MKIGSSKIIITIGLCLVVFVCGILAGGYGVPAVKARFFPESGTILVSKKADQVGPIHDLSEFLVNLDGGGMVKTEISIEALNAKSEKSLKTKEIHMRDKVIAVLGSKRIQDIEDPEGREKLKQELLDELNAVCDNQIKEVLFKNFVYTL